jgi:uncharacterized protein
VFVDSSAFVALAIPTDDHHRAAKEFVATLNHDTLLLTSTDVFDETVTSIRRKAGHGPAVAAGEHLLASTIVRILPVEERDRRAAWDLFRDRPKPALSLTDCTTAAMMDRLGQRRIFTFDADFEALEFAVVPGRRRR